MLKILTLLIVSTGILAACSTETDENAQNEGRNSIIQIVASTTHVADLMENIGGELVEVEGLMGPGVDPHEYQPAASDVDKMFQADLIAYNGLHLEAQFIDVFEQLEHYGVTTVALEDAVSESYYLGSEEEDLEYDPHIWFSVELWKSAAEHTADELSGYDPDNAEYYQTNAESYLEDLDDLSEYIQMRVEEVPEESRYLVTAHDAFQYFGEEFDFEVIGLQGLNTQTEAGTGDISQLADFIAEQEINAVFVESSVSSRNIEALIEAVEARGHNLELGGQLYSDALGSEAENADTYIDMYKANIDTIVEALK